MTDNNEIWIEGLGYIPKGLLLDRPGIEKIRLNEDYNFDTFVAGESNKDALSAAKYAAEFPGGSYNPLLIYGESGLGKTHLLHAIALYITEHDPDLKVLYISGEEFSVKLHDEIRYGTIDSFLMIIQLYDVLIVDDIQHFMGMDAAQETFLDIVEDLVKENKQVIITGTNVPIELMGLDIRLKERFPTCVTSEIHLPEFEIIKTGLITYANKRGLEMTHDMNDVIDYIANLPDNCVVGAQVALIRLLTYAHLDGKPVTLDYARSLFEPILLEELEIDDNVDTVESIREDVLSDNPWR